MVVLGKIDSFNHNSDDICEYIEKVDRYIFANDVDDAKKKTTILQYFLTAIGSDIYSLLGNLFSVNKNCWEVMQNFKGTP